MLVLVAELVARLLEVLLQLFEVSLDTRLVGLHRDVFVCDVALNPCFIRLQAVDLAYVELPLVFVCDGRDKLCQVVSLEIDGGDRLHGLNIVVLVFQLDIVVLGCVDDVLHLSFEPVVHLPRLGPICWRFGLLFVVCKRFNFSCLVESAIFQITSIKDLLISLATASQSWSPEYASSSSMS